MTTSEFRNQFWVLFNNIMSNQAPGLDDYEMSVFLTDAERQYVISLYSGKNASFDSFEKTEEVRRYLSSLVKTKIIPIVRGYLHDGVFYGKKVNNIYSEPITGEIDKVYIDKDTKHSYKCSITPAHEDPATHETIPEVTTYTQIDNGYISSDSINLVLPDDLWFITYESAILNSEDSCLQNKEIEVIPVTQDSYYRTKENPFKNSGSRRALRLDVASNQIELVSKYDLGEYRVRYIDKPAPIILSDLGNIDQNLTIDGQSAEATCALHESLHRPILELAVKLAAQTFKE